MCRMLGAFLSELEADVCVMSTWICPRGYGILHITNLTKKSVKVNENDILDMYFLSLMVSQVQKKEPW